MKSRMEKCRGQFGAVKTAIGTDCILERLTLANEFFVCSHCVRFTRPRVSTGPKHKSHNILVNLNNRIHTLTHTHEHADTRAQWSHAHACTLTHTHTQTLTSTYSQPYTTSTSKTEIGVFVL